jgi:tRNA-dihydrouridine synthase B
MTPEIHLAPLQSYTDAAYRNAIFGTGSIDWFYTPYLSVENNGEVKNIADLEQTTISAKKITIPQILPANLNETKLLTRVISDLGFSHININAGCPYPMVMSKGRGASLIRNPELLASFIAYILENTSLKVSVKTRLGIESTNELLNVFSVLSKLPVDYFIVHARTAKQMYKGKPSPVGYNALKNGFPETEFIYNGDIFNQNDFTICSEKIIGQNRWMIGRGILMDPFLASKIKGEVDDDMFLEKFAQFKDVLISEISATSKNKEHAQNKLKVQMEYLHFAIDDGKKVYKKIAKARSFDDAKNIFATTRLKINNQESI